ncbi:MAG: cytochrome c [Bacteroidetes bacterium]|nr:cytochrome c [Bacteroidota bacterium]
MKRYFVVLFLFLFAGRIGSFAQTSTPWVVPEEAKEKVAPFKFTPETVKIGESVFQRTCKSCHGDPGKQNWAKITPPPGDPASANFQVQTDGEMFYRIKTGRAPMPQFGNILSDEERWQVISYVRSFNPNYTQPAPLISMAAGAKKLKLYIYPNYKLKKLYVLCNEITKEKKEIPAKGIEIQLNVKRYFGTLKLGDPKTTNASGFVMYDFPADLPGGTHGIIDLTARVKDESGLLFSSDANAKLAIGKPVVLKRLTDARAMWSVRSKAPVWLILTFSLTLITVWGFIIYILLALRKLKYSS